MLHKERLGGCKLQNNFIANLCHVGHVLQLNHMFMINAIIVISLGLVPFSTHFFA